MKYLDQAKVYMRSGNGGNGCISFRREKFIEFGGPKAATADAAETCGPKRRRSEYPDRLPLSAALQRPTGGNGMGRYAPAPKAPDDTLKVPAGHAIGADDNETLLADLAEPGERVLSPTAAMAASATHISRPRPTARRATPIPASPARKDIWLRLKLIADVGLVGLPNAGKSTFLAACERGPAQIADYPFTTLHPSWGGASVGDTEFVLADMPGLIEGAHMGAGLGDRFLGHVERCSVLLHLVDVNEEDVAERLPDRAAGAARLWGGVGEKARNRRPVEMRFRHARARRGAGRTASKGLPEEAGAAFGGQ